jgi:hypothetical protein
MHSNLRSYSWIWFSFLALKRQLLSSVIKTRKATIRVEERANGYDLYGPRFQFRWRQDIQQLSTTLQVSTQPVRPPQLYPCTHITHSTQHTRDLVPPSNPNPPPPYTRRMPKYSCFQFCCQSINLKMAMRAETCSWYLCNKQHISNHQIVVFNSWLI